LANCCIDAQLDCCLRSVIEPFKSNFFVSGKALNALDQLKDYLNHIYSRLLQEIAADKTVGARSTSRFSFEHMFRTHAQVRAALTSLQSQVDTVGELHYFMWHI
jgi:hypothetical protein